ncbi:MAG: DEAD/DEAH box helicase [Eubacteriaceae bacterium]|nr:DEAD/DEAH box helicase [Eubacteriaceae bacterium]
MSAFSRLSRHIQEFVYAQKWPALHSIQEEAIASILGSERHLLISSATASGKTEAAFFPILTLLEKETPNSISVLYVGALKALINDQFERLSALLADTSVSVWKWHADASAAQKAKLLKSPSGILQITPESLEALLLRSPEEIPRLFCGLRFAIIDEVHSFMGTDRGSQLMCQIAKIERWAGAKPRRVGLSATLGDPESAAKWLGMGSDAGVDIVLDDARRQVAILADWHKKTPGSEESAEERYYEALYRQAANSKSIIFTNSRGEAEEATAKLRSLAARKGDPDIFYVHHGSISKALREEAEEAMKHDEKATATAATLTLELGIDIGRLEKIAQIGAPFSESSFIQRIGRSGRREGGPPPRLYFTYLEEVPPQESILGQIPWQLVQMAAIIQLYAEERWIEPAVPKPCPYSLLFQQTVSMLYSLGELSPSSLAREVLTLPPFAGVSKEDYRELLRHLLDTGYISRLDGGGLCLGHKSEAITSHYSFYAVFPEEEEYEAFFEGKSIGRVNRLPVQGGSFMLAGRHWIAEEIDIAQKKVYASIAKGSAAKLWSGTSGELHSRVAQRMKQALTESEMYAYLSESAKERLSSARAYAKAIGICSSVCSEIDSETLVFAPWPGTKQARAWSLALKNSIVREICSIGSIEEENGFAYVINTPLYPDAFMDSLSRAISIIGSPEALLSPKATPYADKYDSLLPERLHVKSYAANMLEF